MTATLPASRSAAPLQSATGRIHAPGAPQPHAIALASLQPVLAAYNAANLAGCYLERGNIAAARRKLVQALASVNQVIVQGGAQ